MQASIYNQRPCAEGDDACDLCHNSTPPCQTAPLRHTLCGLRIDATTLGGVPLNVFVSQRRRTPAHPSVLTGGTADHGVNSMGGPGCRFADSFGSAGVHGAVGESIGRHRAALRPQDRPQAPTVGYVPRQRFV